MVPLIIIKKAPPHLKWSREPVRGLMYIVTDKVRL